MAKDYKDRGERRPKKRTAAAAAEKPGRWILIGCLIFGFIGFLAYLKATVKPELTPQTNTLAINTAQTEITTVKPAKTKPPAPIAENQEKKEEPHKPVAPEFTFYTILPKGEAVVPEHELKARIREELVGTIKTTQYTVQAGAFRDLKDADRLKAELALMGIASKIEKALIGGNTTWHRVKLGPYTQLESVEKVKARLKKNGIDVMVTEVTK